MSSIPSVSLQSLVSNDSEVITNLENNLENIGFFILKDHGLNLNLVRDAFSLSKDLFSLPYDIKKKYHVEGSNGARGYTPYGIETALNENVPDQKEFWHQGSTTNKQLMPNLYIEELNEFNFIDDLYREFENTGLEILRAIAKFNITYNCDIVDSAVNGNSILRLIHYPATEGGNEHRARAHNDVNLITLLIGGNEAGLEAQDRQGNWVSCNCSEDEIICNIGDMLELISNKKLKSTTHRVVAKGNESKSRYSIPFFLHPRPEVVLDKSSGLTADEFLTKRLQDIKLN
ncbi:isopenicillin N synthase family oxygenase [Bacteroidota bacterium]|nr:isopenicillin N synthase family oxygenase [Bacteroidota bacterium]